MMSLCPDCLLAGNCRKLRVRIVTDAELANPHVLAGIRYQARSMKISHHSWPDKAIDMYARFEGVIIDAQDQEVWLDTELFFASSGTIYWFRDFACTAVRPGQKIHVRQCAWERTRVFATILRAHSPLIAQYWDGIGRELLGNRCG